MSQIPSHQQKRLQSKKGFYEGYSKRERLALLLFSFALTIYLSTRLIRLPDFPIYFFTDEAIQTQHAADLLARNFRGPKGIFLPTYFENGGQYNLSASVYAQVLPTLIFGKSVWVTRGFSVLVTMIAAVSLGLILRDHFESRYWWLGPSLLAVTPAWFLHSRTAFETVMMASLFAGFLYFYLRYRQEQPKYLYPALTFGALAFYAYNPGQVIMVVTGLMLLIADARYHWRHRKTAGIGLLLLFALSLPYLRFHLTNPGATRQHLILLNAYWVRPIPLHEKLLIYFSTYIKGFNPLYWFWPNPSLIERFWPDLRLPSWLFSNQHDLIRHTMKGYGHILLITLPLWVVGLVKGIKKFKDPTYRTLLLACLAAPSGAALVDWGITRGLVFIIPTVLIIGIGCEAFFDWIQTKWHQVRYGHITWSIFLILSLFSFWMLGDALVNGSTWYDDYGLYGLQYGGSQIFTRAAQIARDDPETTVLVSSTWANDPDVLLRYYIDDLPNVRIGNINAFGARHQPLDRQMLFVMTAEDLTYAQDSDKFTHITIEEILPYPDGSDGFYFVRLAYAEDIEEILAAEQAARQKPFTEEIIINGQLVSVTYPALDMGEIGQAFDGDPATLIRTLEANPLKLSLTFPQASPVENLEIIIGGTPTRITVRAFDEGEKLETLIQQVDAADTKRTISLHFKQTDTVDELEIEIYNVHDDELAHVHLWEVTLE